MIITIAILFFSHIAYTYATLHGTEPAHELGSGSLNSLARFTLVANRSVNAFVVHWTGRVKITTVPN